MKRYLNYLKANNKGQGMTEYVVILALVVGLIVAFFPTIREKITDKSKKIGTMIETGKEQP